MTCLILLLPSGSQCCIICGDNLVHVSTQRPDLFARGFVQHLLFCLSCSTGAVLILFIWCYLHCTKDCQVYSIKGEFSSLFEWDRAACWYKYCNLMYYSHVFGLFAPLLFLSLPLLDCGQESSSTLA